MTTEILTTEQILFALICWICGGIFLIVSIVAYRSKRAVSFYAQMPVAENRITNIPAYNRENAVLWAAYSIPYFLIGFVGTTTDLSISGILLVIVCVGSIPALILAYQRIYRKYSGEPSVKKDQRRA